MLTWPLLMFDKFYVKVSHSFKLRLRPNVDTFALFKLEWADYPVKK